MSNIVKIFVATKSKEIGLLDSGPDPSCPSEMLGNFDIEEALLDWESRITGRSCVALVEHGDPEAVAEVEGGPVVRKMPTSIVRAFEHITDAELNDLAKWWVAATESGTRIDLTIAVAALRRIVSLVQQRRLIDEDIHCWCE